MDKIESNQIKLGKNGQTIDLNNLLAGVVKNDYNNSIFGKFDLDGNGELDETEIKALKSFVNNRKGNDGVLSESEIKGGASIFGTNNSKAVYNFLSDINNQSEKIAQQQTQKENLPAENAAEQKIQQTETKKEEPETKKYIVGAKDTWYGIAQAKYGLNNPQQILEVAHKLKAENNAKNELPKEIILQGKIKLKDGNEVELKDSNAKVDESNYKKKAAAPAPRHTFITRLKSSTTQVNRNAHAGKQIYKSGRYTITRNGATKYYARNGVQIKKSYFEAVEAGAKAKRKAISGCGRYSIRTKSGEVWYFSHDGKPLKKTYFQKKEVETIITKKNKSTKAKLAKVKSQNGIIGGAWDWIKNKTGVGASSDKVKAAINQDEETRKLLEAGKITPEQAYARVTGKKVPPEKMQNELDRIQTGKQKVTTKADEKLEDYKEGQEQVVDTVADVTAGVATVGVYGAAVAAAPFTGGASVAVGIAAAAAAGAAIKVGIKAGDAFTGSREYTGKDAMSDAATGAIDGALAPVTAGAGGAVGKAVLTTAGKQIAKEAVTEGVEQAAKEAVTEGVEQAAKEAVSEGAEQAAKEGAKDIAKNGAKSALKDKVVKASAKGAEMVTDGALNGAGDNAFRTAYNGGSAKDIAKAAGTGFIYGAAGSVVIGGGMMSMGKFGSRVGSKIKEASAENAAKKAEASAAKAADKAEATGATEAATDNTLNNAESAQPGFIAKRIEQAKNIIAKGEEKAKALREAKASKTDGVAAAKAESQVSPKATTKNTDIKLGGKGNKSAIVEKDAKIRLANKVDIDLSDLSSKLDAMKDGESFIIGRNVKGPNDIAINNSYVSGQHLKIEKVDGKIVVTDLSSTNGTVINTTQPNYAAKFNPNELREKFNGSKSFDSMIDDNYAKLRHSNYTPESTFKFKNKTDFEEYTTPWTSSNMTKKFAKKGITFDYKPPYWSFRSFNGNKVAGGNVIDRVSLNVVADKQMLKDLDNLLLKGEYVATNGSRVKLSETPNCTYKTPMTADGWLTRHDPITMYLDKKASPEFLNALTDITKKYARKSQDGKALMNSLDENTPWIANEPYTSKNAIKALYVRAKKLNPSLGNAILEQAGGNWNVSTGQFAAMEKLVNEFEMYLKIAK